MPRYKSLDATRAESRLRDLGPATMASRTRAGAMVGREDSARGARRPLGRKRAGEAARGLPGGHENACYQWRACTGGLHGRPDARLARLDRPLPPPRRAGRPRAPAPGRVPAPPGGIRSPPRLGRGRLPLALGVVPARPPPARGRRGAAHRRHARAATAAEAGRGAPRWTAIPLDRDAARPGPDRRELRGDRGPGGLLDQGRDGAPRGLAP